MSVLTEVEDLLRVIACAKSRPYTDPSRVLLMGCSQGGFVSAITAARLGEEVEALILLYPALCIPDDLRAGRLLEGTFDPVNLPETIPCGSFLLGRRYVEDMAGADAFQLIRGFPGDVLLVHGDADRAVDLSYSQSGVPALPGTERRDERVQDPAGGHGRRRPRLHRGGEPGGDPVHAGVPRLTDSSHQPEKERPCGPMGPHGLVRQDRYVFYFPKPSMMSTISMPMRCWASLVAAPMWGVQETLGWLMSAALAGGSTA